jgi:hypothetical protein
MAAEILAIALSPDRFELVMGANFLATLPFIAILVGSGYWLKGNAVQTDHYPQVAS